MKRLTRTQQVEQSRERVLAAAYKQFQEKGYHGASLEDIADDAGYSKGVIYSRFGSKDDLFLALIERQMEWRGERIIERAKDARDEAILRDVWEEAGATSEADAEWLLATVEFRIHAARNTELNERYARLHTKTLAFRERLFEEFSAKAGHKLHFALADFARFSAALDTGGLIERLVEGPGSAFELSRHATRLLLTEMPPQGLGSLESESAND